MKNKPFDLYKFLTENKVTLGKYETTEQNGVYKGVSDIRKTNHDVVIKEGKFQLNTLKKSTVNESIDLDDYAHELQTNILKVVGSKKIAGWRLTTDQFSGTFEFYKKDKDTSLLATPMWEGESEIVIDIVDDDGEPTFIKMIDFKPTFDIKKDTANYIKIMKKAIPALEKKYSSLQESINENNFKVGQSVMVRNPLWDGGVGKPVKKKIVNILGNGKDAVLIFPKNATSSVKFVSLK